jgi:hypothetical protein
MKWLVILLLPLASYYGHYVYTKWLDIEAQPAYTLPYKSDQVRSYES